MATVMQCDLCGKTMAPVGGCVKISTFAPIPQHLLDFEAEGKANPGAMMAKMKADPKTYAPLMMEVEAALRPKDTRELCERCGTLLEEFITSSQQMVQAVAAGTMRTN